jgi:hypothetical protein
MDNVLNPQNANAISPVAVASDLGLSNVLPEDVAPAMSVGQQYDQALDSGEPHQMIKIAQANPNTPVAIAATRAADLMHFGTQTINAMVKPIEDAGGLGTPQGNIAAATEAKKYFSQEKPQMWNSFIYALTGNKKMAQAAITGGDVLYKTVPDKEGNLIQVGINQLGKIVDAEDVGTGQKLSRDEYQSRAVGRQTYENTLDYKTKEIQAKANAENWNAKTKRDSIAEQSYRGVILPLARRLLDDSQSVKDIAPEVRSQLFKYVNNSMSSVAKTGESKDLLKQKQANAAINEGKQVSDSERIALGLPAGLYSWTKEGVKSEKTGESKSWTALDQDQSTKSKSNELENNYSQTQQQLTKYFQTLKLPKDQQDTVIRILDSGKEIGRKLLELQPDMPKFLFTPNTTDSEDPFSIIQGKAVQLLTNGQLLRLNAEYTNSAKAAADRKGGLPPNPFDIENGFARSSEFRQVVREGMDMTNELLKRHVETRSNQDLTGKANARGAVAPPPVTTSTLGAPPEQTPSDYVGQNQAKERADLINRGANFLPPAGLEATGKFDPKTGKPLFKKRGT